jgi:hypothetical protein
VDSEQFQTHDTTRKFSGQLKGVVRPDDTVKRNQYQWKSSREPNEKRKRGDSSWYGNHERFMKTTKTKPTRQSGDDRPNILLLFPDQWRFDFDGRNAAGDHVLPLELPHIRRLTQEGTHFLHC